MPNIPSSGWAAQATHPDTNRVYTATPLSDPQLIPSLNALPEIRFPVPLERHWQDLPDEATFSVYLDGEQQPIDILTEASPNRNSNQVVLHGEGGTELSQRVSKEYRIERRHTAAQNLIDNETTYTSDVPTPSFSSRSDVTQQNPTTDVDFTDLLSPAATSPLNVTASSVTTYQSSFALDDQEATTNPGLFTNVDGYNNGTHTPLTSNGETIEWEFTIDYEWPEVDTAVYLGLEAQGSDPHTLTVQIDGTDIATGYQASTDLEWEFIGRLSTTAGDTSTLSTGTHTLTVTVDSANTDNVRVDLGNPFDERWNYTRASGDYASALSSTQGYLDGPNDYPDVVDAIFDTAEVAFSVTAGDASITIDDTTGDQYLAISNDRGVSYPHTTNNGTSVSGSFSSLGTTIKLKVGIGSYPQAGTNPQSETPRFGYNSQELTAYTLDADYNIESLLVDESYEDRSIESILTDFTSDHFVWSYWLNDGTETVTFIQPGTRTRDTEPGVLEGDIATELSKTWSVTVKGANRPVRNEQFTASASFVSLGNTSIAVGSEAVYDDTNVYIRDVDYQMDYQNGEIRTVSSGNLNTGDNYRIDYAVKTSGSYTDPNAPANPTGKTAEIPAVSTDALAEQIAGVLVGILKENRYVGDVRIPNDVGSFNVVEALDLTDLGVPDGAGPFEIVEPPRVTPEGIRFRVGSRRDLQQLESAFNNLVRNTEQRLSAVSRRT